MADLNKTLKSAPYARNLLIIIKQGLGAGVTLDSVESIGAWIDVGFKNVESLIQSVCRSCGYADRAKATYNVYCNTDLIENYLEADESIKNGVKVAPDALTKKRDRAERKSGWIGGGPREGAQFRLMKYNEAEAESRKAGWFDLRGITHMKDNSSHDLAEYVLKDSFAQQKTRFIVPGICSHHTNQEAHEKNYQQLVLRYPELRDSSNIYNEKYNNNGFVFCPIGLKYAVPEKQAKPKTAFF